MSMLVIRKKESKGTRSPLNGKIAIITGSGRGIGKAIAVELAYRGASVVLSGRNEERLAKAESEISKINPAVMSVCCDVSVPEGGAFLINEVIKARGGIDILINNAGQSMRGNLADLDPAVFRTMFESNVFTSANVTIPALKHLRKSKGSLVFISSVSGIRGLPYQSAYCASKMALRAIAESARIEERGRGLHIGVVYVGFTENEPGKKTILADGSGLILEPRKGKGVMSMESVALAVVRSIEKRRFITTLSTPGKLNALIQPLFPGLVEKLIILNIDRFMEKSH